MLGLACPYGRMSEPLFRNGTMLREIIAAGAFAAAVESGLTPRGRPIALVRGHRRNGRKRRDWHICDTRSGLRLIDSEQGLLIQCAHDPPLLFSGFSVSLEPQRWERIGHKTFKLLTAGVRHVAVLEFPDEPCYIETKQLLYEDPPNVEETTKT